MRYFSFAGGLLFNPYTFSSLSPILPRNRDTDLLLLNPDLPSNHMNRTIWLHLYSVISFPLKRVISLPYDPIYPMHLYIPCQLILPTSLDSHHIPMPRHELLHESHAFSPVPRIGQPLPVYH